MTQICTIVDPSASPTRARTSSATPLEALGGKRVVILDIQKARSDAFATSVAGSLPGATVEQEIAPASQRLGDEDLDRLSNAYQGAVLALADCGTCSAWAVFDAIELNRRGCRAVLMTTDALRKTVETLSERLGMPGLPVVTVPAPNRDLDVDEIAAEARAACPAIVAALEGR